ncbi:cation:proton antiporter [Thermosyntropha sp.]|uniref:cation:proton antiporter domain-containing protein n=1 Tax=Thermosyntropha sp. TaxID=2740820 RepID=UPI0025EE4B1F|nr:cation:proton antiporter [Thermosyntropha sp.]MBO8159543.1 cation:proton antiporter [Thermosyntropha sp.]
MEFEILREIVVIFVLAVGVLFLCHRLKIPSIVGFLLTGVLVGPYGLGLVESSEHVHVVAEIGVIMLLFSIGLEFSFKNLASIKKTILLGGSIQVGLTILFTFLLASFMGIQANNAVFLGFLVSLSSTAIVLKQLTERVEINAPHGKTALGILIYQDIIVVLMMLFTPLLGEGGGASEPLSLILLKAVGIIILVLILSLYVVPPLLYQITRTQSRELFMFSIIAICFFVAWLTYSAGLSLALGAFLAGLIISESEYSHQALSNIMPFIDTFTSLFFVSIGMLLDINVLAGHIGVILLFTFLLIAGKSIIAGLAAVVLGYPLRIAVLTGFALAQIGEFSFILAQVGMKYGLITDSLYQGFLSSAILTMMLTPFLMNFAPRVARLVYKLPLPKKLLKGAIPEMEEIDEDINKENHLVIIGYGLNGRNLSRAASYAGIPYVILEINADTVRQEKAKGEPIYYGDATHELVLKHVSVEKARVVVVAISDSAATRRVTYMVRKLNPLAYIIVRTRFVADMHDLYELGADEVIPEEFETSIEIFARVLAKYLVPHEEIEAYVETVRREGYEMLRSLSETDLKIDKNKQIFMGMEITSLRVPSNSFVAGRKIEDLELRKKHGVTVVAIQHENKVVPNPGARDLIMPGDVLFLLGEAEKLRNFVHKFGLTD